MRLATIVLGVSLATSAWAQQADDDEKPGARTGARPSSSTAAEQQAGDANAGNPPATTGKAPADTLPGETGRMPDPPRSPATTPPGDNVTPGTTRGTTSTVENVGDAPVRLRARPGRGTYEQVHVEGAYTGVTVYGDGTPPRPPRLPTKGPQRLTWPGFQIKDGVPTVFLETTATPDYTVNETPGALVVTLRGTTINLRNNQRPLKVGDFGTDVSEIAAKPHGKDVIVTIRRTGAGHRERVEPAKGGFQMLLIELPQKQGAE